MTWTQLTAVPWILLYAYWAYAARNVQRTVYRESLASRLPHLALLALGFFLIYATHLGMGPLERRFVPASPITGAIGLLLTSAGCAFAVAARRHLGRLWSGIVTLKEDHHLIDSGPYAITRHPIYTGFLLALFGAAFTVGSPRAFLGVLVAAAALLRKIAIEERLLASKFPEEHARYRAAVGKLIPFL
jgi:protein-S-isoprenylcysteine O-methyltransferase Ste14